MEAIGSEVGQKMRSAIKAKLMELGCYVDDELPDYVMVMVANKRTRSQMEDDLQLFLTNNTEAFVCWLHQVLQKLQEVTINTNFVTNTKKTKAKRSVDASSLKKERKDKDKKKEKEKLKARLKLKAKKSKKEKEKKSDPKDSERTRPNVPPLFMNLEKESSPSITDVFAGQILKSHGIKSNTPILLESETVNKHSSSLENEVKSRRKLLNRNRFPIIDPNTVSQITETVKISASTDKNQVEAFDILSIPDIERDNTLAILTGQPRAEKIKEINDINAKIQTLKKRLAEQLESGSEDEDFINLRTEAEELMGVDFNEDNSPSPAVIPEIKTPPLIREKSPETPLENSLTPVKPPPLVSKVVRELVKAPEKSPSRHLPELPQIELNLPKRPLRDRLGVRPKSVTVSSEGTLVTRTINMVNPYQSNKGNYKHDGGSSEKTHLDKLVKVSNDKVSVKSRLTLREEKERVQKKEVDVSNKEETVIKRRIGSRVVPLPPQREEDPSVAVASIVRAPPRPAGLSGAPASQLLMRAVADAHKSLLSMPPKNNMEAAPKKKALVLPMRRNVDPKKIIIEVSSDKVPTNPNIHERRNSNSDFEIDMDTESLGDLESDEENRNAGLDDSCEYVPEPLGKKVGNFKSIDYVPTHIKANNRTDVPVISRILHFKTEKPDPSGKDPQFVVTLDGLDPNIFLEKKLGKEIQEDAQNKVGDTEKTQIETNINVKQEPAENISKSDSEDKISSKETIQKANENPLHRTNIKISLSNLSNKNSLKRSLSAADSTDTTAPSTDIKENFQNKKSGGDLNLNSEHSASDVKKDSGTKRKLETHQDITFNHKDSFSPIIFHETENSKLKQVSDPVDNNSTSKYDSLPSLPPDKKRKTSLTLNVRELKCRFFPDCRLGSACEFYHPPTAPVSLSPVPACRAFPNCVFGDNCVYGHPMCKFDKSCTRKGCPYTHTKVLKTKTKLVNQSALAAPASPAIASRVVPVSNYKSISATPLPPICKFYPICSNPGCHFFHPKPCRFGKFCINKIECNFYHHDMPNTKWTS